MLDPGRYGGVLKRDRKICAVGVHVSRGVVGHGIGLNVFDAPIPAELGEMYPFEDTEGRPLDVRGGDGKPGYLTWGFSRITACGIPDKTVTWLDREIDPALRPTKWKMEEVADVFAGKILEGLNESIAKGAKQTGRADADDIRLVEGIDKITEEEVLAMEAPTASPGNLIRGMM
jgi:hypothetical protein